MMLRRFCLLFLLLISSLATSEKYALLVGINDYPNDISPLRYCVADVVAFRDALINVAGFEKDNVYLMTDQMDGQMQPTNINVIMRLGILAKQIKADDTFVFYFSGHGIVNDGSSFLLAANSNTVTQDTLEMSAVPLDRVSKILSSVKAQQLLTVIDACRNNPETGRSGEDNVLTDDFSKGFKIRRSSSNGQPSVSATLYACNVGERAYEWSEKGHGVFSYYLLEGLNGKAANSQGQVTVTGLAEYTQSKVVDWAETYRNKKQTPWLSLQGGAKLVLADGVDGLLEKATSTKINSVIDAEAEMWQLVKDSNDPDDIQEFLTIFPEGKLAKVAAFKLRKLQPEAVQNPSRKSSKSRPDKRVQDERSQARLNHLEEQPGFKEDSKPKKKLLSKVLSMLSQPENETNYQGVLTQITWGKDNSQMVLIPEGTLEARDHVNQAEKDRLPIRRVKIDDFYMDITEVTNQQYRLFIEQSGHREPYYWYNAKYNQPNQPVVGVDWYDAQAYANWVGKRLPTEAEWEYAARGGLIGKLYVWGDDSKPSINHANSKSTNGRDRWLTTSPVGSLNANGFGLYDMAGNVWEWCSNKFNSPYKSNNKLIPSLSDHHKTQNMLTDFNNSNPVTRGACWYNNRGGEYFQVSYRHSDSPTYMGNGHGFRCVADVQ